MRPASPAGGIAAEEEIDLLEYLGVVWKWRRLSIWLTGLLLLPVLVFVFIRDPKYVAVATLIPEGKAQSASLGAMSGIASRFGLSLPAGYDPSALHKDILLSRSFLRQFDADSVTVNQNGERAPIREFLKLPPGSADTSGESIAGALGSMISYEPMGNISNLSVTTTRNPYFAADLANRISVKLQEYNENKRVSKVQKNRLFVEQRMVQMEQELRKARQEYTHFRKENLRIDVRRAPHLQDQMEWMQQEVRTKLEIYLTLKKEYEVARIDEEKERPYVTVLDAAVPPGPTFKPATRLLFVVAVLVGLLVGAILSFVCETLLGNRKLPEPIKQKLRSIKYS